MTTQKKATFLSIIAASLILSGGSALYVHANAGPAIIPVTESTAETTTSSETVSTNHRSVSPSVNGIPSNLTQQETLRISDTVSLVTALSPLSDDGIYTMEFTIWRVDSASQTATRVYLFKSEIPAGFEVSIRREYSQKEYIIHVSEGWEGYYMNEFVHFTSDGQLDYVVKQPSSLEMSIESKGQTIRVKPYGDLCVGNPSQDENTHTTIKGLIVNNEVIPLNEPTTLNCGYSEMLGGQFGDFFKLFHFGDHYADGTRHAFLETVDEEILAELILGTDGKVNVKTLIQ